MNADPARRNAAIPVVFRLIEVMRDAHRAPRTQWRSFAGQVEQLPDVPLGEAGAAAAMIAKSARRILLQLPHAHPASEAALRLALLALSDVLNQEANVSGCEFSQPFWARD